MVPNKYPALVPDGSRLETTNENYEARSGTGAHEVIIESPHHVTDVTLLNESQFEAVLRAYRNRIMDLRNRQTISLHPYLQEPGHRGWGDSRTCSFAVNSDAHDTQTDPGGDRDREKLLPSKPTVCFL